MIYFFCIKYWYLKKIPIYIKYFLNGWKRRLVVEVTTMIFYFRFFFHVVHITYMSRFKNEVH